MGCSFSWAFPEYIFADQDDLTGLLAPIRQRYGIPALAAAFGRDGVVSAIGAVGVRKRGSPELVQTDDLFHIGSNTKSMTATMIATLVEDGILTWQTTLADAFPDLLDSILPDYYPVDLITLLSHRSGIADLPAFHDQAWTLDGPLPAQRLTMLQTVLNHSPADPPGTQYRYSNWGYVMAGTIAEHATGQAWEDLIQQRLFNPLGLQSAGFGAPGSADIVDQPWGHSGPSYDPVTPGRFADNPPVYGPAGTVHCSLTDFVNYGIMHARGENGEPGLLLTPDSFQTLHRDWFNQFYALGWGLADRDWAGGRALTHNGSNTYWYHTVWIAPARNAVLLTATNCGVNGFEACDAAAGALVGRYLQ